MTSVFLGSLIMGLIIGAIPAIIGGVKGKLGLGLGGFAACVVGSIILGMLLSIPLCALFLFLIFKKSSDKKGVKGADAFSSPGLQEVPAESTSDSDLNGAKNKNILEQLEKLAKLRNDGALTEEEFQQKKNMLLSRM